MRFAQGAWRQLASLALALVLGLAISPSLPARAAPSPEAARAMIDQVGKEVLAVLGDAAIQGKDQQTQLVELLDRAIDLDTTGRLILGRTWRTASEQQRADYQQLFRPYALDNLASKIRASNAKVPLKTFEIVGEKVISDHDLVIATDLFWPGYAPYRLEWRLREAEGGVIKAIDVVVQGVSMVVSQRSEFSSVIARQGMDGLLDRMRQQVQRAA